MSETLCRSRAVTPSCPPGCRSTRRTRWSVYIETTVCRVVIGQFKVNVIAGSVDDETPIRYPPHSIGPFEWSATKPAVTAALEPHSASPEPDAYRLGR